LRKLEILKECDVALDANAVITSELKEQVDLDRINVLSNARICSRVAFGRGVPIVLSIIVLASGCSPKAPTRTEGIEVIRPVKTMVVSAGAESHVRSFPGKVEASNKVELAFQVSGLLVNLPVREGQKVTENELIAQLRPDEFQARLRALQGQLDRSRADLQALRAGGTSRRATATGSTGAGSRGKACECSDGI
jgi:multidrug efflux pump subunit AcrA (membrane-fusion protein)